MPPLDVLGSSVPRISSIVHHVALVCVVACDGLSFATSWGLAGGGNWQQQEWPSPDPGGRACIKAVRVDPGPQQR